MNVFKIFSITLFTITLLSCRKYVENVPVQGLRVLVYTQDYRLLMNNKNDSEVGAGLAASIGCDDVDLKDPNLQENIVSNTVYMKMYTWGKPFYVDKEEDFDWNAMYKGMFTYNTVIEGVLDSKNGTLEERNSIYAEALVQRAYTYFTLVNCYAKQCDAATAATDPGVPLLLKAELFVNLERATVDQVYAQILKDLAVALPLIPVNQPSNVRPNRAAAYALLAKVHLNMRNFEAALAAAEQSLSLSNVIIDYKQPMPGGYPTLVLNRQVLLRKVPRLTYSSMQLSDELRTLLGTKDLRYSLFTRDGQYFAFYPNFTGRGFYPGAGSDQPSVGLTVTETYLIRAECLARAGRRVDALQMLNDFRKLRFLTGDYVALTATTDLDALKLVIDERRREFFGTGLRWFDQKRLNKDPLLAKTVTRVFNGVTYTLLPNSNAYVFPLSTLIVTQNPELKQNPE